MIVVVVNVLRYILLHPTVLRSQSHFIISLVSCNARVSLMICVDVYSIGLISHSGICSCLMHKAVRQRNYLLLISRHPGRRSAAPQPISRAEQHTRTARRFGPSAIPPFTSARCRLRAFCSFADCNHACYILKETGGSSFVRTL